MVVNDYLMQQLICYLESNSNLNLLTSISGFTPQQHILMIDFNKTNTIVNKIILDIKILMINIIGKLKKDIKQLYPFYQSNSSIIVMKTISNLIDGYISLNDIRLKNVVIYVTYLDESANMIPILSTIYMGINFINWKKFIVDNGYILFDTIKEIKEKNCYYNSNVNFELHLTEFEFNILVNNNKNNLYMHKLLGKCILKIYHNFHNFHEFIINAEGANKLEEFLGLYYMGFKVNMGNGLYTLHIKLFQKYQSKADIIYAYLLRLIIALSDIVTCLIDNPEVEIIGIESDSDLDSDSYLDSD